ncbi:glycosyltransferase [Azonexus sp. IMCC34842]|uniref:glycosyltransferase n=1 Tax=Azonexus sp. IMCC34842 TaxID=3420950 RepID=UPI003D1173CB
MAERLNPTQNFPLVSIVTPTYNQAEYLAETIESVLSQTYPNIEYIVLDDGSTDNTQEVLKQFDGRIRHERHANIGQAQTLNKGWNLCEGKYIGYLSSDDLLYPNAISELVVLLEKEQSIVCVFPDSNLIDNFSRVAKRNICHAFDLSDTVVRQECYIGPGAIFRKTAFDSLGGWRADLKLAPDREFWIRISSLGRIEMCNSVLAGYRMHPDSISYKDVSENISREYLRVLDGYFSGSNVPKNIADRQNEAYGYAYLLLARNSFRAGNIRRGIELYGVACSHCADLRGHKFKARLLRNVVSRPIRRLISFFRAMIDYGRRF